jgi:hypothetical protein
VSPNFEKRPPKPFARCRRHILSHDHNYSKKLIVVPTPNLPLFIVKNEEASWCRRGIADPNWFLMEAAEAAGAPPGASDLDLEREKHRQR